jgi:hypothetical protein
MTRATMRSQRSPAKPNAFSWAESNSRESDSRSSARARKKRVRTVASGIPRQAATSATSISSTARSTNTSRKASGSSSILASMSLRDSARSVSRSGWSGDSWRKLASEAATSIADSPSREITSAPRARRLRRASDSLTTMRTSHVDSFASPRQAPMERKARSQASCTASSASASSRRMPRAARYTVWL